MAAVVVEERDVRVTRDADEAALVVEGQLAGVAEGVVLRDATAIDEAGRIIGLATTGPEGAAKTVPFVWDPEAPRLDILGGPDTTGTPEPGGSVFSIQWDSSNCGRYQRSARSIW